MQERMKNPAMVLPDAMQAIGGLLKATGTGGVPQATLELVHLRASQINGCSACVDSGARAARKAGESDERLFAGGSPPGSPPSWPARRSGGRTVTCCSTAGRPRGWSSFRSAAIRMPAA
jgi:AhpD family alkylhydroperoxidase